jgi:hypothetical protein
VFRAFFIFRKYLFLPLTLCSLPRDKIGVGGSPSGTCTLWFILAISGCELIAKIAFLYFGFLAWGCLALLPVVKLQEVGQGFYRFFGFLCVGLQTLSVGTALWMGPTFDADYQKAAWAMGFSLLGTLCFTTALKIRKRWFLWTCFWAATVSGLAAIAVFPWMNQPRFFLLLVHAACSALVLGAGILAMMLGHWYLVTPKLSIAPLKRYSAGYILLTAWILVELGLVYLLYFTGSQALDGGKIWSEQFLFILFRVTWGLAAPLGLAYWIWETVKMKSTQSATGILYASMVCTMIGEGMSIYLTLATGVPL